MDFDRWQRIEALLGAALTLPANRRRSWLREACRDDSELEREVASLVVADREAGDFLSEPSGPGTAEEAEPEPPDLGSSLGRYRLIRRIGGGGSSHVFLAVRDDGEVRKRVALKLLRQGPDRTDLVRRFRVERQVLSHLEHPHIARFLDGGVTEDGRPYLVMEYVEGLPIDLYCDQHGLSPELRIELFRDVCAAVHHAHRHLVVHRDLKPSNVLVTPEGVAKLLDFGIAKILAPDRFAQTVDATRTGMRPMTPLYASPEQVRGEPITTASDVYSLGVLLYQLLAGRSPYRVDASSSRALERAICDQEPDRLTLADLRRRPGSDLEAILLMALRKEPNRRYGSAEQLSDDLLRLREGLPVAARRATWSYGAGKFLRRHRWAAVAAAALLALVTGFAAAMTVQAGRIARERDRAVQEAQKNERIAGFLEEVFAIADPVAGLGDSVTAHQLLDWGADRLGRELSDQPEVRARLLSTMGRAYQSLGAYERAEELLREAVALERERFGPESLEVAQGLNALGVALAYQGDREAAEPLLRQALSLRRRLHHGDYPEVAETLNDLAFLLGSQGDYEAAEPLFREALDIDGRFLEDDDPEVGIHLNNLALLQKMKGDLAAAEPLYRQALAILRNNPGEDSGLVARVMSNLANVLMERGAYDEAEALHRESVERIRRTLGTEHDGYALSLHNLARLLLLRGRPAEAEGLVREALSVYRRILPAGHWRTANTESLLGEALAGQGRYREAEALLLASYPVVRDATGERSPYTRDLVERLVRLYEDWGRPAEAARAGRWLQEAGDAP